MKAKQYCRFLMLFLIIPLILMCSACDMFTIPDTPLSDTTTKPLSVKSAPTVFEKPHQIALLLPGENSSLSKAGNAIKAGFMADYQNDPQKPEIKIYDQDQYNKAVQDGADMIVGPLEKKEVESLEKRSDLKILTLALNQPDSNTQAATPNLIEFSLSPTQETQQLADKIISDGRHSALLITPAGDWGQNISNAFRTRFQTQGGTILDAISVSDSAQIKTQIQQLLKAVPDSNQRRQDFDVIVLLAQPAIARQIKPLLDYYHADNIPTYSTSLVYSGLVNPVKDQPLNGIIFCDMPIVLDEGTPWAMTRQQMLSSQPFAIQQYIRLYGLGWDAAYLTKHFDELQGGIYGAVGKLSLPQQSHYIQRTLKFAVFKNGKPEILQ